MTNLDQLQITINDVVQDRRGILAADESGPTIKKRFQAIQLESTEESRRAYRDLLMTTPGLGEYLSGVIFFDETMNQKTDAGVSMPAAAWSQKIVPGIKVDEGTIPLALNAGEFVTEGADGLATRLRKYKEQGARFAKWRGVFSITDRNPGLCAIEANAARLAYYAAVCQEEGIVPIVEPEVLMDGGHSIERCAEVTEAVLHAVFHALHRQHVSLELMILKPNMVAPGTDRPKVGPKIIAAATTTVLRRTVPSAVPSINFLSGGEEPEEATANLNAMNQNNHANPWKLGFSFGRALQQTAIQAWRGKSEKVTAGQKALLKRARLNSLAMQGKYSSEMESGS